MVHVLERKTILNYSQIPGFSGPIPLLPSPRHRNPNLVGPTHLPLPPIPCHPDPRHLVIDNDVVLGCHVVSYVVVNDETQQPIEQGQVNLLIHLLKSYSSMTLHSPSLVSPHILQVIDAWGEETQSSGRLEVPFQTRSLQSRHIPIQILRPLHSLDGIASRVKSLSVTSTPFLWYHRHQESKLIMLSG